MRIILLGVLLACASAQASPTFAPLLPMGEQFTSQKITPRTDAPNASLLAIEQRQKENASNWSWAYKIRRFFAN